MTIIDKYLIVKEFFGLSAINIDNVSRTFKERQEKTLEMKTNFNILESSNTERLK